jgi:hypothetical protein
MTPSSLFKLVRSLSRSEKRYFKLQSKIQAGNKEYLILFDLIDELKSADILQVKSEFKKLSITGSWENTCLYLGKLLVESLVRTKKEKDLFFNLVQEIQEIRILNERSLDHEAYKLAKKVQQKAAIYQLPWIEYFCYRYQLNYHSDNNFSEISDETLVKIQMSAKDVLKSLNHIHDHYSLYELLKHRLIYAGKIVSEEGKKKLNDLMLSEMALVAGKSKSFASKKLHLLFQSFFFTDIGDYHSALKSFYQLNELLEKNEQFLDNPPLDYMSALVGIIDSLRMLHNEIEISYYVDKLGMLDVPIYPEYFRYQVRKTVCAQRILLLLQTDQLQAAKDLVESISRDILYHYTMVDEEKQSELFFYHSLVYFKCNEWHKAHLYIREIMNQLKLQPQLLVSKAIRLLNIIIYYEKGELLHLEYEIRSYKRFFMQSKLLKTEKLLLKVIAAFSINKRFSPVTGEHKKILNEINKIGEDRYEQQLSKYFDFPAWINLRLLRRKLSQV